VDFDADTSSVTESFYMMDMHVTHKGKYVEKSLHIKSVNHKAYQITRANNKTQ